MAAVILSRNGKGVLDAGRAIGLAILFLSRVFVDPPVAAGLRLSRTDPAIVASKLHSRRSTLRLVRCDQR